MRSLRRFWLSFLIAVFPFIWTPAARAQTGSSILGRIFDDHRQPVANMWVELLDEVDSTIAKVRTDGTGHYVFRGLSNGVFQVRVITAGTPFAEQTQRINLVPMFQSRGANSVTEHLDFTLKPHPGNAASQPSGGLVFAQDVPQTAQKAYEDGISLIDANNVDAGVAKLKEAVDAFPTYYAALERLGQEYVKLGQHEPALAVLGKAVEVNPKGQESLYAMGVSQYRLRRYAESTGTLRRAFGLAPTSPNAAFIQYFLGLSLLRDRKASEAEPQLKQAYDRGLKTTLVPADVHMALAQIYSNNKRYKEAIDELELYLKEAPDAQDREKIRAIIEQLRKKAN
jgi:tetratricopeptide (TPR) repeat protein